MALSEDGIATIINEVDSRDEEIVNFCSELVKIPSEVGDEQEIQDHLYDYLKGLDMPIKVDKQPVDVQQLEEHPEYTSTDKGYEDRPNVVAKYTPQNVTGPSLALNGHTDVVPAKPVDEWQYDPWGGEIIEGKIFGRGACDMKAGVVAIQKAFEILANLDLLPNSKIRLEYVVDEEDGGNGTLAATLNNSKTDAAIIPEPTECDITPAHRGAAFWRIIVEGLGSHGGRRYKGINAVDKALLIYERLKELEKSRNRQAKASESNTYYRKPPIITPINLGKIQGGDWISGVPERCVLEGSMEILPEDRIEQAKEEFERIVHEVASYDEWLQKHLPKVEWFGLSFDGAKTNKEHPLVQNLVHSYQSVEETPPKMVGFEAGGDMRIKTAEGTPSLLFGPGNLDNAHRVDEFVSIPELLFVTKVLAVTIARWDEVKLTD